MNLIKCIVAVVAIGLWCAGMVWNMIKERELRREREDLARYKRARAFLRLRDKPYWIPEQNETEIKIIKLPEEPEAVPRYDYRCRT